MNKRLATSIISLILLSVFFLKADRINAELRTRAADRINAELRTRAADRINAELRTRTAQKTIQILIEGEDPVMVELFGKELQNLLTRSGTSVTLSDNKTKPYDFRIFFTSGVGSKTDSCTGSFSTTSTCPGATTSGSCSSCHVTITLYFTSAVVLKPDGMVHSADTGMGIAPAEARNLLARKLLSRLL
jgi:hypothetical protein